MRRKRAKIGVESLERRRVCNGDLDLDDWDETGTMDGIQAVSGVGIGATGMVGGAQSGTSSGVNFGGIQGVNGINGIY